MVSWGLFYNVMEKSIIFLSTYVSHSNIKTEFTGSLTQAAFPTKEMNHFKATSYLILTSTSSVTSDVSAGD